jgi:hypothetical protein
MKAACRMTVYTRRYLHLFLHGLPFIQAIDSQFKKLVPKEHARQLAAVSAKKNYQIPGTAFSTLTVNLNFRTALHKDDGDFKGGFGNLSVIEWGKYHGGYTLFPRFGVGFDVRTGDFIAMDVHEWHCNTPMYETPEDKVYNMSLPDIRSRDPTTGLIGSEQRFQRLTFVCYFRDRLQVCDEGETAEYYARSGFDEEAEIAKAKSKPTKSLLLPQYNEMEDVQRLPHLPRLSDREYLKVERANYRISCPENRPANRREILWKYRNVVGSRIHTIYCVRICLLFTPGYY